MVITRQLIYGVTLILVLLAAATGGMDNGTATAAAGQLLAALAAGLALVNTPIPGRKEPDEPTRPSLTGQTVAGFAIDALTALLGRRR